MLDISFCTLPLLDSCHRLCIHRRRLRVELVDEKTLQELQAWHPWYESICSFCARCSLSKPSLLAVFGSSRHWPSLRSWFAGDKMQLCLLCVEIEIWEWIILMDDIYLWPIGPVLMCRVCLNRSICIQTYNWILRFFPDTAKGIGIFIVCCFACRAFPWLLWILGGFKAT